MKTKKRDKTSVIQSHSSSLERWLDYHYDTQYDLLNLSWYEFHWYEYFIFAPRILIEDPSYKKFIPIFMHDPNPYLLPEYKGLSLFGQAGYWSPKENMKDLAANTTLEYLDLGGNKIGPDDIRILATNNHIKELDLAHNYVGEGVAAFAENRVIEALYVPYNGVGSAGAQAIGKMAQLKTLDISHNPIKDADAAAIINQLKNLRTINLEGVAIGKETIKALLANNNLTKIHLGICQVDCFTRMKINDVARRNYNGLTKLSKSTCTLFGNKPKAQLPDTTLQAKPLSYRAG